jgi:hypothetical protein
MFLQLKMLLLAVVPFEFLKRISDVRTQWSLAAFAIAAVVILFTYVVAKPSPKIRKIALGFAGSICLLGLVPILASAYLASQQMSREAHAIYRVRVTVLDAQGAPLDDARVWSTLGGETKTVAGGCEIDIPAAGKPKDGQLTVFAEKKSAFLRGKGEVQLKDDVSIAIVVAMKMDLVGRVRGIVQDGSVRAVAAAWVMVVGYGTEAVKTSETGSFDLPAHAALGQQVLLHAEKKGYKPTEQWQPAAEEAIALTIIRER